MNANISEIRTLLESYYDGSLSPEGMAELRRLLGAAPSLPPELEVERRMLMTIDRIVPEPPAGLQQRLENAIDAVSAVEKSSRRPGIIIRISAIAAAVAACLSGVMFLADVSDDLSPSTDPVIIAQADLKDTLVLPPVAVPAYVETAAPTVSVPTADAVTGLPEALSERKAPAPRKARKKRRGARVITDPDEALAYIEATFDKIADDVQVGDRLLETAITEATYCNILLNK